MKFLSHSAFLRVVNLFSALRAEVVEVCEKKEKKLPVGKILLRVSNDYINDFVKKLTIYTCNSGERQNDCHANKDSSHKNETTLLLMPDMRMCGRAGLRIRVFNKLALPAGM